MIAKILRTDARKEGFHNKEWSVGDPTLYLRRTERIYIARDTVLDRMQRAGYRFNSTRRRWELTAEPSLPSAAPPLPEWDGGVVQLPGVLLTCSTRVDVLPTVHELLVLRALRSQTTPLTERKLVARLVGNVSAVSMTLLLYRLEKKGWIARTRRKRQGLLPQERDGEDCLCR
jgi:hypothetical protein